MANPNSTPARIAYAKEWREHPDQGSRADYRHEEHLLLPSPAQIEAARLEMSRELSVQHWSQVVAEHPRTVVGKFNAAPDGGFTEVGISGRQIQGGFTGRQPLIPGTNVDRLSKILAGGEGGMSASSHFNFVVAKPPDESGRVGLVFVQFQNGRYGRDTRTGNTSMPTTFHLPPQVASGFMGAIRQYPDLLPRVFDNVVSPALEPVYRTVAESLLIAAEPVLGAAESERFGQGKLLALNRLAERLDYALPHGGEVPSNALPTR